MFRLGTGTLGRLALYIRVARDGGQRMNWKKVHSKWLTIPKGRE
jgi:hypothetical protein